MDTRATHDPAAGGDASGARLVGADFAATRRLILTVLLVLAVPAGLGAPRVAQLLWEAPTIIASPLDLGYPEHAVVRGVRWWRAPDFSRRYSPTDPPHFVMPYPIGAYLPASGWAELLDADPDEAPSAVVAAQQFAGPERLAGRMLSWLCVGGILLLLATISARAVAAAWRGPGGRPDIASRIVGAIAGLLVALLFLDQVVRLSATNLLAVRGDALGLFLFLAGWIVMAPAMRASTEGEYSTGSDAARRPTRAERAERLGVLKWTCSPGLFFRTLVAAILIFAAGMFHQLWWWVFIMIASILRPSMLRSRSALPQVIFVAAAFSFIWLGWSLETGRWGTHSPMNSLGAFATNGWNLTQPLLFLARAPHIPLLCVLAIVVAWRRFDYAEAIIVAACTVVAIGALLKKGASYNYLIIPATMAIWTLARAVSGEDHRAHPGDSPPLSAPPPKPPSFDRAIVVAAALFITWPAVTLGRGRLAEASFPTVAALETRELQALEIAGEIHRLQPVGPLLVVTDDADTAWALGIEVAPPDPLLYSLTLEFLRPDRVFGMLGPELHPFAYAPKDAWIVSRYLLARSPLAGHRPPNEPLVREYYGAKFHPERAAVDAWSGRWLAIEQDGRVALAPTSLTGEYTITEIDD